MDRSLTNSQRLGTAACYSACKPAVVERIMDDTMFRMYGLVLFDGERIVRDKQGVNDGWWGNRSCKKH